MTPQQIAIRLLHALTAVFVLTVWLPAARQPAKHHLRTFAALLLVTLALYFMPSAGRAKGHCGTSTICYHKDRDHHAHAVKRDDRGRIARSHAAKDAFMREH